MLKFLERQYRKIPESYIKAIIRNIISYAIHHISSGVENISIHGVKIRVYKNALYKDYNNPYLAFEVSGYNKYYKFKKDDVVIDAGAYSGFFSIYAAKQIGKRGKVIAFEPDSYNLSLLKRNLLLNNIKNVIIVNKGLYSADGKLPFYVQGIGSSLIIPADKKSINKIDVVSLDNELKRLQIYHVDFIKMDIEGGEIEAVKGCLQTIKNNKKLNFAIASYHLVDSKKTYLFLEKFFKKLKMEVITENDPHTTTYASNKLEKKKN